MLQLSGWVSAGLIILSMYHPPDGVVLDVLGIEAGVELRDGLEGAEPAVDPDEQQLKLSIGGTVRQPFLQESQALPHGRLFTCDRHNTGRCEQGQAPSTPGTIPFPTLHNAQSAARDFNVQMAQCNTCSSTPAAP